MVSTPKPPDPMATAQAQAGLNRETAITQAQLNQVNQVTPYGNLTYAQSGQNFTPSDNGQVQYYNASTGEYRSDRPTLAGSAADTPIVTDTSSGASILASASARKAQRDGKNANSVQYDPAWQTVRGSLTPSYTATTTLSPQQQAILDQTQSANLNLGTIANERSAFLKDYLSGPLDLSGAPALVSSFDRDWSADRQKVEDAMLARMAPQQQQDQDALRASLINSGIRQGTAAWDSEWDRNARGVNDSRLAAILAGGQEQSRLAGLDQAAGTFQNQARGQYMNEAYAQRNQPLNEIGALLSGSQVQQPTFQQTPQTQVGGVDYMGMVSDNYKAQVQSSAAQAGGMFGLLAAPFSMSKGFSGLLSDRRAKRDVEQIGHWNSLPWYRFNYVWESRDAKPREGLLSEDVRRVRPEAVKVGDHGFDLVDYSLALEAA